MSKQDEINEAIAFVKSFSQETTAFGNPLVCLVPKRWLGNAYLQTLLSDCSRHTKLSLAIGIPKQEFRNEKL
jgi:putative transposon-encoded protein